jgi:hypothetical protein
MLNSDIYYCRVCGFRLQDPPWGDDGKSPSYDFCSCCGVEFGYGDASIIAIKTRREKWITSGANWDEPKLRPVNWNLEDQLQNVPKEYL